MAVRNCGHLNAQRKPRQQSSTASLELARFQLFATTRFAAWSTRPNCVVYHLTVLVLDQARLIPRSRHLPIASNGGNLGRNSVPKCVLRVAPRSVRKQCGVFLWYGLANDRSVVGSSSGRAQIGP